MRSRAFTRTTSRWSASASIRAAARKFGDATREQCRPALRHRARRQGDQLAAGHPRADPRRQRHHHRQLHGRDGATTSRCCCAPARCRRRSTIIEERTVGPDLGADSIDAGKIAGVVGWSLVLALHGRSLRPVRGLRQRRAGLQRLPDRRARCRLLQATLTLPGIAGIVLTIGMAVDANVLIFERIREEVRNGRVAAQRDRRRLPRGAAHHHRRQPHHADRRRAAVRLRLRPGAGFAVTLASASSPRCSPRSP